MTFVSIDADLVITQTMAICLLGYAGFPRFNKMASMGECDVKFYNEHLEKFLLNRGRPIYSGMEHGSALLKLIHLSSSHVRTIHEIG